MDGWVDDAWAAVYGGSMNSGALVLVVRLLMDD